MINDNKAYTLRIKAASRLKQLPSINTNNYVLDSSQLPPVQSSNAEFKKTFKHLLTFGESAMREGKYETAINVFTEILKIAPNDANVIIERAKCFQAAGRQKLALKDLDSILLKEPNHGRALLAKAEILYKSGDYSSALTFFEEGIIQRQDMTAFTVGFEKTKHAMESSSEDVLYQPNLAIDDARSKKKVMAELGADYYFLQEFKTNVKSGETSLNRIRELIEFIDKQNERLLKH